MEHFFFGLRILQVAFGIGLVVFVHEAGHYMAARMCGVRVDIFSLGFGPRLWAWRRGATTYQIALVPFGGYVRMAGEELMGGAVRERDPRPDELASKSPAQRFFIYSGGVLMNGVFALVVLPIVFLAGVPSLAPIIGEPAPGSPAWHARLTPGLIFHTINGAELNDFQDVTTEMALNGSAPVTIEFSRPGQPERERVTLQPEYNEEIGIYLVGVRPGIDPELTLEVQAGSPAAAAGLQSGDRLLGLENAPRSLTPVEQLLYVMEQEAALELQVQRGTDVVSAKVEPRHSETIERSLLGLQPGDLRLLAVRAGGAAAQLDLRAGDLLRSIGGRELTRPADVLPALLQGSSNELWIERGAERVRLELPDFDEAQAVAFAADLACELDVGSARLGVLAGSPAEEAGILRGDRLLRFNGELVASYQEFLDQSDRARKKERTVELQLERNLADGASTILNLKLTPRSMPPLEYGLALKSATYIWREPNVAQAIATGFRSSVRFAHSVWQTLRKMSSGEVSSKNMSGIITISVASHSFALEGWAKLFFFLCLLSVNLAFLNVLPIPVLDGGHLFFILVEMIKGSPVSERTLGYSQVVGLVLIVSLMVYVTYNDVMRLLLE